MDTNMASTQTIRIPMELFKDEVKTMNMFDVERFLKSQAFMTKFHVSDGHIIKNE